MGLFDNILFIKYISGGSSVNFQQDIIISKESKYFFLLIKDSEMFTPKGGFPILS
jgi:hypothetical protein